MANPFSLIIAGVDSGNNLLDLPAPSATTTPYVDLGSLSLTMSADGKGGSMSFDVIQVKTPSGTSPWWRSGAVYDNARVQFFDSRYSATTPLFLGYITGINASLLENGLGTRASVSVSDADGWLQKTIIRNPKTGITVKSSMDSFTQGGATSTDRDHINALLAKIDAQVNDATTRQILNTSTISGSNRAVFTGTAQVIGAQSFKATNLQSALDQIAEAAGGVAEVQYRYWIDGDGRLNYGPKLVAPTASTAPLEIVTDPANVRVGGLTDETVGTSRILARDLTVNLDHDSIVKGIFVQAADTVARYDSNNAYPTAPTNDPYFRTYDGTYYAGKVALVSRTGTSALVITEFDHGFASGKKVTISLTSGPSGYSALNGTWTLTSASTNTMTFITSTSGTITYGSAVGTATAQGSGTSRTGAGQETRNGPLPHEIFSAPKVKNLSDRGATISSLTRATMVTRGKPVRTVSFTVAGGNISQTSNPDWSYGYSQGYAIAAYGALASRTGTTATITTAFDHPFRVGDSVRVSFGAGPTGYEALNGVWTITEVPSSTTFKFTTVTSGTITSGVALGSIYYYAKAWLAGQYVKLIAPEFDLPTIVLFVATVSMRFVKGGGSYQVEYDIDADYRRQYLKGLSVLIGAD
jgi:hypothetical protein